LSCLRKAVPEGAKDRLEVYEIKTGISKSRPSASPHRFNKRLDRSDDVEAPSRVGRGVDFRVVTELLVLSLLPWIEVC
jgi:hypothetical protein